MAALIEKENVMATEQQQQFEVKKARIELVDEKISVRFVRLNEKARMPAYGSVHAAGADLHASEAAVVPARGKVLISTGLCLELPEFHYGRVAPRSGLAAKHSIDVGAGVIDCDYRGELKVLLFNFSDVDFEVKEGDRIAQLICEKISQVKYVEVDSLEETQRGAGGFGSTGVSA
ncbi:dut-1 [Pristionchus pacificus]|uniref:Deoxyuridine 5'-triphosphate nucleotidohydrolase n=1 Tax=Pristionchus pacificus TaxID=54126 RepID=A0A8R1YE70_PRIPA|nr:dut-1 [Pristionchus pacificus]